MKSSKLRLWLGSGALPGDAGAVSEIVNCAIRGGVDTFEAAPEVLDALRKYPRESYRLFARCGVGGIDCQLADLGIDRLDFVMLTDLTNADAGEGFDAALEKLRRRSAVGKTGVRFYGGFRALRAFLAKHADAIGFCCIQYNYMDWSLQRTREKAAILRDFGLPLIAAEPLRRGLLGNLPPELELELKAVRPDNSPLDWGVNWLKAQGAAAAIVDAQSKDELAAYIRAALLGRELSPEEQCLLYYVAGELRHIEDAPPCSDCPHCADVCPVDLDIPLYIGLLTDLRVQRDEALVRQYRSQPPERRASACVGCFKCAASCPKGIPVPLLMTELEEITASGGDGDETA